MRAIHLADQLTRRVTDFHGGDGKPLAYNSSVGIAECPPYDDLTTLLIHADRAMYAAKQAGGGGWRIFDDEAGAEEIRTRPPPPRRQPGLTSTDDLALGQPRQAACEPGAGARRVGSAQEAQFGVDTRQPDVSSDERDRQSDNHRQEHAYEDESDAAFE